MAYTKTTWVNGETPINADNLNNIEGGIKDNETSINDIETSVNDMKGTILWENPSPTANFSPQEITLTSSDYDCLEIYYYDWIDTKRMKSQKVIKGANILINASFYANGNFFTSSRPLTYNSDTSYSVGACVALYGSSSFLINQAINYVCVPVYIIGYKTGLFGGQS